MTPLSFRPLGRDVALCQPGSQKTNIWTLENHVAPAALSTGAATMQGDPVKPAAFQPAWSPDWAMAGVRTTPTPIGVSHDTGFGWGNTQELSVTGFERMGREFRNSFETGLCLGSPKMVAGRQASRFL